ncbi:AAA family ATPase [Kineococcus sp. SYSU DK005]|uniref:AAA family ATPase n=1 Tax=Kineococcus sp. SYSU DK005 TaxID=3383126 RepID=UPI003D7CD8AC
MPPTARALRRIEAAPGTTVDETSWPDSVPAVRQLLTDGLEVPAGVTFLVGENGAGKSTLLEAVAELLGAHAEGGTRAHLAGPERGRSSDTSTLGSRLRAVRGAGGRREVFFLRAETMHRFYDYLEESDRESLHPVGHGFHHRSHGEGFLDLLESRYTAAAGLLLLDEPESALSFDNCLVLAAGLQRAAEEGKQVLCATHSPLLTALPGATVLEVGAEGIRPVAWEDLAVVKHWRFFLDAPERYWRRVL